MGLWKRFKSQRRKLWAKTNYIDHLYKFNGFKRDADNEDFMGSSRRTATEQQHEMRLCHVITN